MPSGVPSFAPGLLVVTAPDRPAAALLRRESLRPLSLNAPLYW